MLGSRLIDLSLTVDATVSEPVPVTIEYVSHQESTRLLGRPWKLEEKDWPDGLALSIEKVSLTSHTGTHLDAPMHYGPVCEGCRSKTVDELPLEWFFQDGVVIDCQGGVDDGPVTLEDVLAGCDRISYRIKPKDIVLIRTGADKLWGKREYFTNFRGMTVAAVDWLLSLGVKVIGIDSFGLDPPFEVMLRKYTETGDQRYLWPTHIFGRSKEYCQLERLANLNKLPRPSGFRVACFPIKIKEAGAGWARVVAIYD